MKRMTALLLAIIMVMGMLPTTVLADGAAPPNNVRWTSGNNNACLSGAWDPPAGGSHESCEYNVALYYSADGESDWKSLNYYYYTTYSFSPGMMTVDSSYIAMNGEGYYKFTVCAASVSGVSAVVESDIYPLDYSKCAKGAIAKPLSGSFDAETKTLSWTDPEGIDPSNGMYSHNPIVEVWYTGEDGSLPEADWTMIKRERFGGYQVTSVELSDLLYADDYKDMKTGRYVFKVSNLAEDYLWRGGSEAILLDGYYDYVADDSEEEPAIGNAPSGVAWTNAGGITWDLPSDAIGLDGVELELLYTEDYLSGTEWVPMDIMYYNVQGSLEKLAVIKNELGARVENKMEEAGYGWYNVRMCYHYADGDSDWTYAWPRLFENGGGQQPSVATATGLEWNTIHTSDTASKAAPGYMAFRAPENSLYELSVYYRSSTGTYNIASWSGRVWDKDYECVDFIDHLNDWNEGRYYFTVQLRDDNGNYGEVATSDDWTYVRPSKTLQAANLTWDTENNRITWEMEEELVEWVSVDFWFNSERDDHTGAVQVLSWGLSADATSMDIPRDLFSSGEGWYYFKIRLGSKDVTQALNSQNEPLSGSLHFTGAERQLALAKPTWTGGGLGHAWYISEDDAALVHHYEVDYYYSESADVQPDLSRDFPVYNEYFWPGGEDEFRMPGKVVEDNGSGYYYFTVRAVSNNLIEAGDSVLVLSPALTYTVPEQQLTITNPGWTDDGHLTWTEGFTDRTLVDDYNIRFYYGKTEDSINDDQPCWWYDCTVNALPVALPAEMVEEVGTGWYTYDIRAVSADPTAAQSGAWSTRSAPIHSDDAVQPIPQADNLKWGTYYWNDEEYEARTGAISFTGTVPNDLWYVDYEIRFYRQEVTGDVLVGTMWTDLYRGESIHSSVDPFEQFPEKMESGIYYFTVTAMGRDGYANSAAVKSDTWEYKRPSAELTVSDPVWGSGMTMNWTNGSAAADGYRIQYQVVKAGGEFNENNWRGNMNLDADEYPAVFNPDWLMNNGTGDYYFRVRALSNDITQTAPSAWSEASPAYPFTAHNITLAATNLRWNEEDCEMLFDLAAGTADLVKEYQIQVWYSKTANEPESKVGTKHFAPGDTPFTVPDMVFAQKGPGYYWFRVRPYTKDITKAFDGEWSGFSAPMERKGPETLAPKATELQWDIERWNANDTPQKKVGNINFKNPCYDDTTRTLFYINIYRLNEDGSGSHIGSANTRSRNLYVNVNLFEQFPEKMQTGTYYYTVITPGDYVNTSDSELAVSGTWDYERPAAQKTISTPVWNTDGSMNWTDGANKGDYYQIRYLALPKGKELESDDWTDSMTTYSKDEAFIPSWIYEEAELEGGTCWFKVRAMSNDPETDVASDWTGWSGGFTIQRPEKSLEITDLIWDETTGQMKWKAADAQYVYEYEIEVYYSENETIPAVFEDKYWIEADDMEADGAYLKFPGVLIDNDRPGYYWYRVKAYTNRPAVVNNGGWSDMSAFHQVKAPTGTLGTPNELYWNKEARWGITANGVTEQYLADRDGCLTFKRPVNEDGTFADVGSYRYELWQVGGNRMIAGGTQGIGEKSKDPYVTITEFLYQDLPSGSYYYKVWAVDQKGNYANGDIVTSEAWTYTRPNGRTTAPDGLLWNDTDYTDNKGNARLTATWAAAEGAQNYTVEFFFAEDENAVRRSLGAKRSANRNDTGYYTSIWDGTLDENGEGLYFFRVRAIPADISAAAISDWSSLSEAYDTRPSDLLTRAQLAVMIAHKFADQLQPTDEEINFTDIENCTEEEKEAIILLAQNGIVAGTASGVFSPNGAVTGKQAALVIYRAYTGDRTGGMNALDNAVNALIEEGILYQGEAGMAAVSGQSVDIWLNRITTVAEVKDALDDLLQTEEAAADVIQNAVSELEQLDKAMAADAAKGEKDTVEKLKQLEETIVEKTGIQSAIEVSENLPELAGAEASNMILNADLTNVQDTTVTLNISAAAENIAPPADMIDPDNAVVFSMDIENAKDANAEADGHQLLIPMQIKLPILIDINPAFLVVLHERADGTWEELSLPYVHKEGEQWYATFNVTGFSNYAIGERAITAKAEGKVVTIDAHLPACGTETTYMCAVYAANGQMLGMNMLKPWADRAIEIDLIEEAGAGAYVRIFAPDIGAGWTVPVDALRVEIE